MRFDKLDVTQREYHIVLNSGRGGAVELEIVLSADISIAQSW